MVSHIPQTCPPQNGARTLTSASDYMHVHAAGAFHESGRQRRTSEGHEELGSASTVTTREEIEMPLAKIHVLEGQYDEARLGRVSSAVQNGLISALGIPPEASFRSFPAFPGVDYLTSRPFSGLAYPTPYKVWRTTL